MALVTGLALVGQAAPVHAAGKTFSVNSTVDAPDANPGNGKCETASGNNTCTLRAAIMETNALAGADTIDLQVGATYVLTRAGDDDTALNGDLDINTPDTVIDGKDIRGCVGVNASGVTIRRSKISCGFGYGIYNHTATGLVIEDSEIDCQDKGGTAVGDTNITVRRVNIHGCENGFDVDGNFTVQDSYIHDLFQGAEAHTDGAQITNVGHDIVFTHNTIYSGIGGTSAIISPAASSGVRNVLIRNNLMAGGAYTLYCAQNGGALNYRVIDNRFRTIFYPKVGEYGPWTDCEDEVQVTGNVYHETGQPLPP